MKLLKVQVIQFQDFIFRVNFQECFSFFKVDKRSLDFHTGRDDFFLLFSSGKFEVSSDSILVFCGLIDF